MNSESPILCTAEAIYAFHSNDNSTLSLDIGDHVDIFIKLDSGWWNGSCNGKRGWFPNECVEIKSEKENEHLLSSRTDNLQKDESIVNYSTLSISSSDCSSEVSRNNANLPGGWVIEPTKDGRSWYYYNEITGEKLSQYPEYLESTPIREQVLSPKYEDHSFSQSTDDLDATQLSREELFKNWVERETPQGKTYFCNLITHETTWDYNEIDKDTGYLKTSPDKTNEEEEEEKRILNSNKKTDETSWNTLATDIALAIHQLTSASKENNSIELSPLAESIVRTIRQMLHASRVLEKESYILKNPILKESRRVVVSTLSKLVLSVKMCTEGISETPIDPTLFQKVVRDANEVLVAVRNFINYFQLEQISIHPVVPKLLEETESYPASTSLEKIEEGSEVDDSISPLTAETKKSNRKPKPKKLDLYYRNATTTKPRFYLNQDLISNLQAHLNQIFNLIGELAHHLLNIKNDSDQEKENPASNKDKSLELFRSLSVQISQMTCVLNDINAENFQSVSKANVESYVNSRQVLYDSFGHLFLIFQSLSNSDTDDPKAVKEAVEVLKKIGTDLENLEQLMIFMVSERKRNLSISKDDIASILPSPTFSELRGSDVSIMLEDDASIHSQWRRTRSFSQDAAMDDFASRKSSIDLIDTKFPFSPSKRNGTKSFICQDSDNLSTYTQASGEIEYGIDNTIKGGTLPALVECLTAHDVFDSNFIATFLLTYRSFCTTDEFMTQLEQRYSILPPENLNPDQLETWTERIQKPIRLRVYNILKNWLENYYSVEDAAILTRIENYTTTSIRDVSSFAADQISRLIKKRIESPTEIDFKKIVPNHTTFPNPIYPKNITNIQLQDMDPLELARQLTLMDFKMYSAIRPIECLGKAWSKEDADGSVAVNIKESIQYCNRLTSWVTASILCPAEAKKRASVIKFWVHVAENCRNLNNYNTCMAIISGLDNSSINRLKRTWAALSKNATQTLTSIRKVMRVNRNFNEYRDMIRTVVPPCIPFLGIYLQDLTFIEDGNPDYLSGGQKLINFSKRQKTAKIILELKQFQMFNYQFQPVKELQEYIKIQMGRTYNPEKLYLRSLNVEPKAPEHVSGQSVNSLLIHGR